MHATGLRARADQLYHQDSPGTLEASEKWDNFAASLAAGDFDGDGYDDLSIGVSGEDIRNIVDAGCINVLYGDFSYGLYPDDDQLWHQNKAGVEGGCEKGDRFG